MKIVYICSGPVPSRAANSVHVMKMCAAMAEIGHQVILLSPTYQPDRDRLKIRNIFHHYGVRKIFRHLRVPSVPLRRFAFKSHRLFLRLLLRAMKPDLVYTRVPEAALLAAEIGYRVVLERHDVFSQQAKRQAVFFDRVARHPMCAAIVVISEALRAELSRNFGLPLARFVVAADAADRVDELPSIDLSPANHRVGYAGHLYPGKGLEVIEQLACRMPGVEFHVVGGTVEDVAAHRHRLKNMSNIVFHGHLPPSLVPRYLKAFNVLLAPYQEKVSVSGGGGDVSRWMSPLKIFEYMASRRPMIVSDLPVLREVLQHQENCLLVSPTDIDGWVAAVDKLLANPALSEQLADAAFNDFTQHYTWIARARHVLSALQGFN